MIVGNFNEVAGTKVMHPDAKDALMKVLISPAEGWEGHVMRVFEIGENGFTPQHQHDWPHINYIIAGEGTLQIGDKINPITAGGFAYVPAGALHQFKNTGSETLKFICIVPEEGHK